MINILKSDEGRMFMESMLQPMNNDNFIQSIFKINSFGDGEKGPAPCGHIVTVHYKILNIQNTVLEDKVVTFPHGNAEPSRGGGMKASDLQKKFKETN